MRATAQFGGPQGSRTTTAGAETAADPAPNPPRAPRAAPARPPSWQRLGAPPHRAHRHDGRRQDRDGAPTRRPPRARLRRQRHRDRDRRRHGDPRHLRPPRRALLPRPREPRRRPADRRRRRASSPPAAAPSSTPPPAHSIKAGCFSVWIKADFDVLMRRVRKRSNRPAAAHARPRRDPEAPHGRTLPRLRRGRPHGRIARLLAGRRWWTRWRPRSRRSSSSHDAPRRSRPRRRRADPRPGRPGGARLRHPHRPRACSPRRRRPHRRPRARRRLRGRHRCATSRPTTSPAAAGLARRRRDPPHGRDRGRARRGLEELRRLRRGLRRRRSTRGPSAATSWWRSAAASSATSRASSPPR